MDDSRSTGSWARIANVLLGGWLFLSTFVWLHSSAQTANAWVVGAAVAVIALIAMAVPKARYFNTALAIWLLISAFALPTENGSTVWNSVIVAILIFAFSLVPQRVRHTGSFGHHRRISV